MVVHAVESYVIGRDVDRPEASRSERAQLAERRTSRLSVGAAGKLGQPKQQLYAGSMTTLSPEAFAGHTPMMQHYQGVKSIIVDL
ncbi:hypothetical protein [Burkholderia vietnamiensis]|uniref:hypothetical protein n=1 Tax=Burkholderia vietnamiensis TaxID=60552 RepID=UPI001D14BC07|nr:hypothetical protein [Burkholderia vietnamiensis]UEC01912.1 hypothetical protein LK462_07790 [Burkholderia vietnamiensis]